MGGLFEFLLHPTAPVWLWFGLLIFATAAWTWLQTWLWHRSRTSFSDKYMVTSTGISLDRGDVQPFSNLGRLVYLLSALWATAMVSRAYLTGTIYNRWSFETFMGLSLTYVIVLGVHMVLNHRLFSAIQAFNASETVRLIGSETGSWMRDACITVAGIVIILAGLALASCWLFQFPISLHALLALV